jgi:hypothetical protein
MTTIFTVTAHGAPSGVELRRDHVAFLPYALDVGRIPFRGWSTVASVKAFTLAAAAVLSATAIGVGVAVTTSAGTKAPMTGPALLHLMGCSDKDIQSTAFESICPPLMESAAQYGSGGTTYQAFVFANTSATSTFLRKNEQAPSTTQKWVNIIGSNVNAQPPVDEGDGAVYGSNWVLEIESPNELSLLDRAVRLTGGRVWQGPTRSRT